MLALEDAQAKFPRAVRAAELGFGFTPCLAETFGSNRALLGHPSVTRGYGTISLAFEAFKLTPCDFEFISSVVSRGALPRPPEKHPCQKGDSSEGNSHNEE